MHFNNEFDTTEDHNEFDEGVGRVGIDALGLGEETAINPGVAIEAATKKKKKTKKNKKAKKEVDNQANPSQPQFLNDDQFADPNGHFQQGKLSLVNKYGYESI